MQAQNEVPLEEPTGAGSREACLVGVRLTAHTLQLQLTQLCVHLQRAKLFLWVLRGSHPSKSPAAGTMSRCGKHTGPVSPATAVLPHTSGRVSLCHPHSKTLRVLAKGPGQATLQSQLFLLPGQQAVGRNRGPTGQRGPEGLVLQCVEDAKN